MMYMPLVALALILCGVGYAYLEDLTRAVLLSIVVLVSWISMCGVVATVGFLISGPSAQDQDEKRFS